MSQREESEQSSVPPGFEPVLRYPDGVTGVPVNGLALLRFGENERALSFVVDAEFPALPLRQRGEIEHVGWDIPTRYAIDADGQCWMDGAHGGALHRVDSRELIGEADGESAKNEIRGALGIEFPMPEWAQTAIREGWPPPDGWTWRKS